MGIGYGEIAGSYDELYSEEQLEKLKPLLELLDLSKNAVLLDVGCGTGVSSSLFKCQKVGIDSSMGMLKCSKQEMTKLCAEAECLPFKGKSVDAVISLTAIHNFSDFKKALDEMRRVSSGKVVVSVLKRSNKYKTITDYIKDEFRVDAILETEKDTIFII